MVTVFVGVALALQVAQGGQAPAPEVVTRSRVDRARPVDFHALVVPETVYVGQQATYQLGVFLDPETRQRIRRNPEFQPPETRALLSYDLRERSTSFSATLDGRSYEAHVFRRALFPLSPGRYQVPPARLAYALPQSASFFSREDNYTLRSEGVAFIALEPPMAGRPSDWAGAVGSWRASARLDTARGRTGEPFVLTLRVEGQGNVSLLPRPRVAISWASVVNADERVLMDSTPPLLGGWKEFDWLVTPLEAGQRQVPPIRYAYFNPRTRRYEVAMTAAVGVRVSAGEVAAVGVVAPGPDVGADAPLEIRSAAGRSRGGPYATSPWVIALALFAPLVALGAWVVRRPPRPVPAPAPAERIAARARERDREAARAIRRALMDGLGEAIGVPAEAFARPGEVGHALRRAGVSDATARSADQLLSTLDAACFDEAHAASEHDWAASAAAVLAAVESEGAAFRTRRRSPRRLARAVAIVAGVVLGAATGVGAQGVADAFALGTTAYAGADYVRAARHFADAARAAPRSPAAWANYGTASFLAGDTAGAVVGWQRALRFDPTDATLRARLARVRAPQETGYARVPRVPGGVAVFLGLLTWIALWSAAAIQCWRRRPARRLVTLAAVIGGSALGAAVWTEQRLEAADRAVVVAPVPLRSVPALGADPRATPLAGEVARVLADEGVWVHLRLDGGRDGWIPSESVRFLRAD